MASCNALRVGDNILVSSCFLVNNLHLRSPTSTGSGTGLVQPETIHDDIMVPSAASYHFPMNSFIWFCRVSLYNTCSLFVHSCFVYSRCQEKNYIYIYIWQNASNKVFQRPHITGEDVDVVTNCNTLQILTLN